MQILLHPTYFPSITQMVTVAQAKGVVFEVEDNYQKQTYRNRTHIAHSNGKLALHIPIKHAKNGERQKTKEVQIENSFPWQSLHWKSLQTAYRTSPFFEYYEDDLEIVFKNPVTNLMDHNLHIFNIICELIGLEIPITKTTEYFKNPEQKDLRYLVNAKKEAHVSLLPYTQVLQGNRGFLNNLSVLDLLFNEGPNTMHYLEKQNLFL
ncbi:MAG: WbqC family protein [Flavobacteriaceae bacterium]